MSVLVSLKIWSNYLLFYKFKMAIKIKVTISEKMGVCRVVVHFMELHKLIILQIRDIFRITSRIEPILTIFK
jgi:hypothetical protein